MTCSIGYLKITECARIGLELGMCSIHADIKYLHTDTTLEALFEEGLTT
jgi:hypothetical protein